MTDILLEILPIVLYATAVILLLVLIVLVIKMIKTVSVVNKITEDAYEKMESLNSTFNLLDKITDGLSKVSDSLTENIIKFITGIFKKRKAEKEEEKSEEE